MSDYHLRLTELRPFFAEVPYYLWGQVNYDSEGDCKSPTDRSWRWLTLTNRETKEALRVSSQAETWIIEGAAPLAARACLFIATRCQAQWVGIFPDQELQGWDHKQALARAAYAQKEFERPELRPFDVGHLFWGSWKWIMHSVVTGDKRAVNLCIGWLRKGTFSEKQSEALRYALNRFTGHSFGTDKEWVYWYDKDDGVREYPKPDFNQWLLDLKAEMRET
jgi:hypothetical protein